VVEPSRKVAVPLGVAEPEAVATAAVKVMLVPLTAVTAVDVNAVVVATDVVEFTVIVTMVEVLVAKDVLP
jgi:hypothetical protein